MEINKEEEEEEDSFSFLLVVFNRINSNIVKSEQHKLILQSLKDSNNHVIIIPLQFKLLYYSLFSNEQ